MRRRAGLVGCTILAAGLSALALTTSPASAYTSVTYPWNAPTTYTTAPTGGATTQNLLAGAVDTSSMTTEAQTAVRTAQLAEGVGTAAEIGTICATTCTIALGAGALLVGFTIGTAAANHFNLRGLIADWGTSNNSSASGWTVKLASWSHFSGTGAGGLPTLGSTAANTLCGSECYALGSQLVSPSSSGTNYVWGTGGTGVGAEPALRAALQGVAMGTYYSWTSGCGATLCIARIATPTEFHDHATISPILPGACSGTCGTAIGGSLGSPSSTFAGATAGRDALDDAWTADPTVGLEIAQKLDPDYDGLPSVFDMPDCEGLTAAACTALLESLGYLGTVTTNTLGISDAVLSLGGGLVTSTNPTAGTGAIDIHDPVTFNVNPDELPIEIKLSLANESGSDWATRMGMTGSITYTYLPEFGGDPGKGPDAPVRVRIPKPGGGYKDVPVPYPDPGDPAVPERMPPDDDIEIFLNPPDWPLVPPDGPGGGSPGDCDHAAIGTIDPSPITDIDYGSKFPFGVFVLAANTLDDLTGSAIAPVFSIPVPSVGEDYGPIDLDPFSPYMSTMRTVLAWVIWIGGLWWLGTSLLGFKSSGHPGDAASDYLDEVI